MDKAIKMWMLMLLAIAATTWVPPSEARPQQKEEKSLLPPLVPGVPSLPGLLPPPILDPGFGACWKSVYDTQDCAHDLFTSFISQKIYLSTDCCKAIEGIGEHCFNDVFSKPPFNALFPPLIKMFCASSQNMAPAPL